MFPATILFSVDPQEDQMRRVEFHVPPHNSQFLAYTLSCNHGFNEHAVPWQHERTQIDTLMPFGIKNDNYFELVFFCLVGPLWGLGWSYRLCFSDMLRTRVSYRLCVRGRVPAFCLPFLTGSQTWSLAFAIMLFGHACDSVCLHKGIHQGHPEWLPPAGSISSIACGLPVSSSLPHPQKL